MARKKRQLNLGEAIITRKQLERITADTGMNLNEIVAIAVDRMYREMYPADPMDRESE